LPKRKASHDETQVCHIESAAEAVAEVHDNENGIHPVEEAHETDMRQNAAAVVAVPSVMRRCYYWILDDDPIANGLVVVAHVQEEGVHANCNIAAKRDNILEEDAHETKEGIHYCCCCYWGCCRCPFSHEIFPAAAEAADHYHPLLPAVEEVGLPTPAVGEDSAPMEEVDLVVLGNVDWGVAF